MSNPFLMNLSSEFDFLARDWEWMHHNVFSHVGQLVKRWPSDSFARSF